MRKGEKIMLIDHNTVTNEYIAECDKCHRQWEFESCELILAPWPHVECPVCGEWIAAF